MVTREAIVTAMRDHASTKASWEPTKHIRAFQALTGEEVVRIPRKRIVGEDGASEKADATNATLTDYDWTKQPARNMHADVMAAWNEQNPTLRSLVEAKANHKKGLTGDDLLYDSRNGYESSCARRMVEGHKAYWDAQAGAPVAPLALTAPPPQEPEPDPEPAPPAPPPPVPPASAPLVPSFATGSKRSISPSLDVRDDGKEARRVAPPVTGEQVSGPVRAKSAPKQLTRGQQLEASCGGNVNLMAHARRNYDKPGGMSTRQVVAWYRKDLKARLPSHLQGLDFGSAAGDIQVCHIIPDAKGGHPWPYNYVLAVKSVNDYFSKYMPKQWDEYIGKESAKAAETFSKWVSKRARATFTFGAFDPVADEFLARR